MELPVITAEDTKPPVHLAASVERGFVTDERLRVDSSRMVVVGNCRNCSIPRCAPSRASGFHRGLTELGDEPRPAHWRDAQTAAVSNFRLDLTEKQHQKIFRVTGLLMPGIALALGMLMWSHRRW